MLIKIKSVSYSPLVIVYGNHDANDDCHNIVRLKSKLDKHMAEAPDAQFVAEDAVFVYHKKFSVC